MSLFNLWGYSVERRRKFDEHDDAASPKAVTRYAFTVCRGAPSAQLCVDVKISADAARASLIDTGQNARDIVERARYLARVQASMQFKEHDNKQREGK